MYAFYDDMVKREYHFINTESSASAVYFREFAFLEIMTAKILAKLNAVKYGDLPRITAKKFTKAGMEIIANVPKTYPNEFIARPLLQVCT